MEDTVMGMDVSGKNPKINVPKENYPVLSKWDDIEWGKRNDDEWNKEQKLYWKEKEQYNSDNPGVYFRNNVWWWRPLWYFCCTYCNDIISQRVMESGSYNDGSGLNDEDAFKLGTKLLALIADGTASEFEKAHNERNEEIKESGEDNFEANYPFSVENVEEFAYFCLECGGFEIW
tara:strand:+ start:238 stop:762 length:525 start_codon:yes stop_codon:yes gene_type:complete